MPVPPKPRRVWALLCLCQEAEHRAEIEGLLQSSACPALPPAADGAQGTAGTGRQLEAKLLRSTRLEETEDVGQISSLPPTLQLIFSPAVLSPNAEDGNEGG